MKRKSDELPLKEWLRELRLEKIERSRESKTNRFNILFKEVFYE